MRTKATFLAGFAAGYVLGAKAGRARYEQIREAARSFMNNPTVASTTSTLQHQAEEALVAAKDRAAHTLSEKFAEHRPAWMGSSGAHASEASGPNGHRL